MLHSGEVSGKEAGVLVDGGSFTMDGGTIYGAQCGIHVGGTPKSTVKIGGGDIKADDTALFAKQGSSCFPFGRHVYSRTKRAGRGRKHDEGLAREGL